MSLMMRRAWLPRVLRRCLDDGSDNFCLFVAALMQFFVSYCRSLIAASYDGRCRPDVQDVIGVRRSASGDDFERVMQFLHLCPDRREDRNGIKAIGVYFRILRRG